MTLYQRNLKVNSISDKFMALKNLLMVKIDGVFGCMVMTSLILKTSH